MKIGVTGASGMVGINVCKEILNNGDSLNILIRKDFKYIEDLSCKKFYGDLNDIETLENFCEGCDVIIHSAAMISIGFDTYDQVYEVNFVGTKNLLDTSIKKNVKKFIFISTVNAYDKKPLGQIFDEKRDLVRKGNSYDMTKALAQELVTSSEEIESISNAFSLNNEKHRRNLIDALKIGCRKYTKEKTGKKPFTNINIIKI